eukprot:640782-Rhodomonas_salina.1
MVTLAVGGQGNAQSGHDAHARHRHCRQHQPRHGLVRPQQDHAVASCSVACPPRLLAARALAFRSPLLLLAQEGAHSSILLRSCSCRSGVV